MDIRVIKTAKILVLNGPNLNMLGLREPEIYGQQTLADIKASCQSRGEELGLVVDFRQSNDEGQIVTWIQQNLKKIDGIIINAAGYTHTSVAIRDALSLVQVPIIEVHLSNIYAREKFRHHSYLSQVATGMICGLGGTGYLLALEALHIMQCSR